MIRRRCARCGNRIRVRTRRCRHCNSPEPAGTPAARGSRRRGIGYGIGLALGLVALLLIGQRLVHPTSIANWYTEFALQRLPVQQLAAVAPGAAPSDDAEGAFYFCIRRVAKDRLPRESVATFPSIDEANTRALGDGRYRVETHVFEERPDGGRVRHHFTCTTRYEQDGWVLQELEMGRYARAG